MFEADPVAITIHARTRKEMSKVPARWERIRYAVEMRNTYAPHILILGNGDVVDVADAKEKVAASNADGAMLGRAIFGNPWLFSDMHYNEGGKKESVSLEEKMRVMVEHTYLFEELLPHKNFAIMKKHYKAYVNGFDVASELRQSLMATSSAQEVEIIVSEFLAKNSISV